MCGCIKHPTIHALASIESKAATSAFLIRHNRHIHQKAPRCFCWLLRLYREEITRKLLARHISSLQTDGTLINTNVIDRRVNSIALDGNCANHESNTTANRQIMITNKPTPPHLGRKGFKERGVAGWNTPRCRSPSTFLRMHVSMSELVRRCVRST